MNEDDKKFIGALRRAKLALQSKGTEIKEIAQHRIWGNPENNDVLKDIVTAKKNVINIENIIAFLEIALEKDKMSLIMLEEEIILKQEDLLLIIRAAGESSKINET